MVVERDEADEPPEVGDPIAAAVGPLIEVARGAVATG
jgi:hypothetical protein